VACALLLSGAKLENFSGLSEILVEMGIYFQAQVYLYLMKYCTCCLYFSIDSAEPFQDDYLDCFVDPNTISKVK
jgi:farnesyl diphosphate synthase